MRSRPGSEVATWSALVGMKRCRDMGGSVCHAPIPDPTQLADLNRVQGARLRTGTLYLIFFFFLNQNLYL